MPTVKLDSFTVKDIFKVAPPASGLTYIYPNEKRPRVGVTVTRKGSYNFHVRATVNGQTKRISIPGGNLDDMTIAEARRKAKKIAAEAGEGATPAAKRAAEKAAKVAEEQAQVTLKTLLSEYITEQQRKLDKPMKDSTAENYRKKVKADFGDYMDQPAATITPDVIKSTMQDRGKACLAALRVLKAVFNYAKGRYPLANPVPDKLPKYGRKTSYLKFAYIPDWFNAVESLEDQIVAQYLLFLLFTGVRADTEAGRLTWEDIDWKSRSFLLRDTKNQTDAELPLPGYLVPLLEQRKQKSGLVFPVGEARPEREEVGEAIGLPFTRHDLRRTFLTIAEGVDVSWLAVKRLANHKTQEHGVTEGYIIPNLERLRKASALIEAEILKLREGSE